MMTEKDFDSKIKELVDSYREPLPDDLWSGIEGSLNRKRRMKLYYRIASYSVAASIVIGLGLFMARPDRDVDLLERSQSSSLAIVEQIPELTQHSVEIEDIVVKPIKRTHTRSADRPSSQGEEEERVIVRVNDLEVDEPQITEQIVEEESRKVVEKEVKPISEQVVNYDKLFALYDGEDVDEIHFNVGLLSNIFVGNSKTGEKSSRPFYTSGNSVLTKDAIGPISEIRYDIPLTFGVQAQLNITERFAVGLGINYSLLASDYDAMILNQVYKVNQYSHFIGVPISLYYTVVSNHLFKAYASVGGSVEKGLATNYKWRENGELCTRLEKSDDLQLTANAGIGLEYMISDMFGIFFDPSVTYYFDVSKHPRTLRSDQPLQMRFELGVRIHL